MDEKCQAAALYDKKDESIFCQNEAIEQRKVTFGTWYVVINLCSPHCELWDDNNEVPSVVRRVGRWRGSI